MQCWYEKDTNVESEMLHILQKIDRRLEEKRTDTQIIISTLKSIETQLKDLNETNKEITNLIDTLNNNYRRTHLWDLA